MLTHLLDTSVYSQPLKKRPLPSVMRRWEAIGDDAAVISVISQAEILYGLELRGSPGLWESYRAILENRLTVIFVDGAVAKSYAKLAAAARTGGRPHSAFDLLIASTAKARNLVVATCDVKGFSGLEGVRVEDWSA